jgi:hypothetical protein
LAGNFAGVRAPFTAPPAALDAFTSAADRRRRALEATRPLIPGAHSPNLARRRVDV